VEQPNILNKESLQAIDWRTSHSSCHIGYMENMQSTSTKILCLAQRLNKKDLMMHKHFYVEFNDCVLCDNCPQETLMHLFFECNFSQAFWWALNIEWDTDRDLHDMTSEVKRRYSMEFIMEIIIIGCWAIWDQRNNMIFNLIRPTIPACNQNILLSYYA
jgi:hypothetical protein